MDKNQFDWFLISIKPVFISSISMGKLQASKLRVICSILMWNTKKIIWILNFFVKGDMLYTNVKHKKIIWILNLSKTRFAEMGVAFQHCKFFFNFSKKYLEKNVGQFLFTFFTFNCFSIILEKEVNIFISYFFHIFLFQKCFFEKLIFFSKSQTCDTLSPSRQSAC